MRCFWLRSGCRSMTAWDRCCRRWWRAYRSCCCWGCWWSACRPRGRRWRGSVSALVVAVGAYGMPPDSALAAAGYGACFGLLPIGWIVLAAVFLFHLTVRTGQFEVVKHSVAAISPDRRMQALLIAFSFGTFVEGAAGFGTPVAISAALMIGLGFSAAVCRGPGADCEHLAGGVRRTRHADHDAGARSRASTKCCSARWRAGSCRSFR